MSALKRLADWYLTQCDGLWEHGCGLSITTLDNPGFSLKINLKGTQLENVAFERLEVDWDTDDRWYTCWKEGGSFHAAGAPSRIEEMVECFLTWSCSSHG
ncbi:immunity 53 family protein [Roseimaritima ulvae]|uniref:immunity 53 family protein n=1 Tax=Roseimaritima ulvae TaxID=980254 RepID=UPI0008311855